MLPSSGLPRPEGLAQALRGGLESDLGCRTRLGKSLHKWKLLRQELRLEDWVGSGGRGLPPPSCGFPQTSAPDLLFPASA